MDSSIILKYLKDRVTNLNAILIVCSDFAPETKLRSEGALEEITFLIETIEKIKEEEVTNV